MNLSMKTKEENLKILTQIKEKVISNNLNIKDFEYLHRYVEKENLRLEVLNRYVDKLKDGVPVQYIVGNTDFYGNTIYVDENVLIPRFETELLVEKTIKYISKMKKERVNVLDIGTGSGCIAITIAKNVDSVVDAVDISEKAISVAKKNIIHNSVDINIFKSDILSNVKNKYDVIISNPPYISNDEEIMDIVKYNEPHLALYAEDKGLYFYRKILQNVSNYLNKEYLIAFEIGYTQGEEIKNMANKYLKDAYVWIEKDYSDKDRFVFISNIIKDSY